MTYALVIPSEFLADLVKIRSATGTSIRQVCLTGIKSVIELELDEIAFSNREA